jgi:hypothetical protein
LENCTTVVATGIIESTAFCRAIRVSCRIEDQTTEAGRDAVLAVILKAVEYFLCAGCIDSRRCDHESEAYNYSSSENDRSLLAWHFDDTSRKIGMIALGKNSTRYRQIGLPGQNLAHSLQQLTILYPPGSNEMAGGAFIRVLCE